LEVRALRIAHWIISILLVACATAQWWYAREARKARQVVEIHDARYANHIESFLRDQNSVRFSDLESIERDRDSAVAVRDKFGGTSDILQLSSMGLFPVLLLVGWLSDRVAKRKEHRDGA
jgi:hypothetical protein